MKRCPECRRDYYDESLLYCLDDGSALLEGPASDVPLSEAPTRQIFSPPGSSSSDEITEDLAGLKPNKARTRPAVIAAGITIALLLAAAGSFFYLRPTRPKLQGSFKEPGTPAYDYYFRGKLDSNAESGERNTNAIRTLEDVVKADPTFAPAYAELARAYIIRANIWAPADEKPKLFAEARVAVEKSLVLDPGLAEGHVVRAYVIWNEAGRFPHEQAVKSLKRAIEIDPNLADAHQQLGLIYLHIGLLDKAKDESQKVIDIDPLDSAARLRLALIEQYRPDYDKALKILKSVPPDTNAAVVNRALASVMFQLGRVDDAAKIVDEFLTTNPDEGGNVTSVRAMLLAKAGRTEEAETTIRRALEIGQGFQHFHHTTYNIAVANALLNKKDEALKWLQYTIDDGFPCYPLFANDRNLDSLGGDQRFVSLMADLKKQWEDYSSKF